MSNNDGFSAGERIISPNYSGPDRRDPEQALDDIRMSSKLKRDARGCQVLEIRSDADCRRFDDGTINLLKILDIDGLTLQED